MTEPVTTFDKQYSDPAATPVKVFAHAKGDPFGATRHRFGVPSGRGQA
jgi:hypothetical protein